MGQRDAAQAAAALHGPRDRGDVAGVGRPRVDDPAGVAPDEPGVRPLQREGRRVVRPDDLEVQRGQRVHPADATGRRPAGTRARPGTWRPRARARPRRTRSRSASASAGPRADRVASRHDAARSASTSAEKVQAVVVDDATRSAGRPGPRRRCAAARPRWPPRWPRRCARRPSRRAPTRTSSRAWASARPARSTTPPARSPARRTSPTGPGPSRWPRPCATTSASTRSGSATTSARRRRRGPPRRRRATRRPSWASSGAPASAARSSSTASAGAAAASAASGHRSSSSGRALPLRAPRPRRGLRRPRRHGGQGARAHEKGEKTVLFKLMEEKGRDRLTSGIWERALAPRRPGGRAPHRARAQAIAAGAASAVNLLDVEAVVLGGGLGRRLGEPMAERLREAMLRTSSSTSARRGARGASWAISAVRSAPRSWSRRSPRPRRRASGRRAAAIRRARPAAATAGRPPHRARR